MKLSHLPVLPANSNNDLSQIIEPNIADVTYFDVFSTRLLSTLYSVFIFDVNNWNIDSNNDTDTYFLLFLLLKVTYLDAFTMRRLTTLYFSSDIQSNRLPKAAIDCKLF